MMTVYTFLLAMLSSKAMAGTYGEPVVRISEDENIPRTRTVSEVTVEKPPTQEVYTRTIIRPVSYSFISANVKPQLYKVSRESTSYSSEDDTDAQNREDEEEEEPQRRFKEDKNSRTVILGQRTVLPGNFLALHGEDNEDLLPAINSFAGLRGKAGDPILLSHEMSSSRDGTPGGETLASSSLTRIHNQAAPGKYGPSGLTESVHWNSERYQGSREPPPVSEHYPEVPSTGDPRPVSEYYYNLERRPLGEDISTFHHRSIHPLALTPPPPPPPTIRSIRQEEAFKPPPPPITRNIREEALVPPPPPYKNAPHVNQLPKSWSKPILDDIEEENYPSTMRPTEETTTKYRETWEDDSEPWEEEEDKRSIEKAEPSLRYVEYSPKIDYINNAPRIPYVDETPTTVNYIEDEPPLESYKRRTSDQAESASGKKESGGGHKSSGGGSEHEEHHASKKGHKGDKGHKKTGKHEKAAKGHHDKESHKGEYKEEKGNEKKEHKEEKFYGEHHKGEKGEKAKKFGGGKKHKKGHSTHGEHNIVKKDEYIKTTKFYDEDHGGGEKEEHGHFHGHHEEKEGKKKEGGHAKKGYQKEGNGKKGHHDKGHVEEQHGGHEYEEGHEDHYGHEEEYGGKKGGKSSKKWGKNG